jgi:hypothetical protein
VRLSYPPVYGIDAYVYLTHEWVTSVLPSPKDEEMIRKLRTLWTALAHALSDFDNKELALFARETETLAEGGREGEPPVHFMIVRLRAAEQAGIQEGFLAVAMREATEYLIARDLPEALNDWTALADRIIPRRMWFSMPPDRFSPSKKPFGPGV